MVENLVGPVFHGRHFGKRWGESDSVRAALLHYAVKEKGDWDGT